MDQASIKAITRHLVQRVGGPKQAAEICGVSQALISNWKDDNHDRFIPIYRLVDLDAAAGDLFLSELARSRGYELTPIERRENNAAVSLVKLMAEVSRANGEFEYTALEAVADGSVTPNEARRIRDRIAPVKDLIAQTEAAIS